MEKINQENPCKVSRITWEGCSVLLDINNGERTVFERLTAAATLKIGNKKFSLQPLIGCSFGTTFQVENRDNGPFLSRVVPTTNGDCNLQEVSDNSKASESRDNRALVDDNTAQSLKADHIDEMKREGMSGDEIVKAIITHSATFEKKTSFSQEKYLLKKQKKYSPRILLRRPTTRSICEAYFKKRPEQIGFLRMDTLSLLLSMANVTSHSNVLLVDMIGGLLTGAVAERLGGNGYVCNTFSGTTSSYSADIVRMFNFSDEILERIVQCPHKDLLSSTNVTTLSKETAEDPCLPNNQSSEEAPSTNETTMGKEENMVPSENDGTDTIILEASEFPVKYFKAKKAGQKATQEAIEMWKENGFSSLIVAAPYIDSWSIVKELFPLLSFSAPFAIYHNYQQPLAQCMRNLQAGKLAINLQLSEPWLREYQVLESRTHPHMQMSTSGGYVLSGTRICSSD